MPPPEPVVQEGEERLLEPAARGPTDAEIFALVLAREKARIVKDYAAADRMRAEMAAAGLIVVYRDVTGRGDKNPDYDAPPTTRVENTTSSNTEIVKSDGERQPFNGVKLKGGMLRALEKLLFRSRCTRHAC